MPSAILWLGLFAFNAAALFAARRLMRWTWCQWTSLWRAGRMDRLDD